jgi:hypothetical protein
MQTVRQIERLWSARQYERMFRELVAFRPEGPVAVQLENIATAIPAAAMGLIRLDELAQTHLPLYRTLLNIVLATQDAEGGWDSPMLTALCVRALMTCNGSGTAVDRGLAYLASLQKAEGIWPRIGVRRLQADAATSLFILYHLGNEPRFRKMVAFDNATAWFAANADALDRATQKFWNRVELRCGLVHHSHHRLSESGPLESLRASA